MEGQQMKERLMYAGIHQHNEDLFDSAADDGGICKKYAEYGAKGFVLTQHGVQSDFVKMRRMGEKYGLDVKAGIEAYVIDKKDEGARKHCILIGGTDKGHLTIGKAITESNDEKGFAVMTDEQLMAFFGPGSEGHGHVFATSACVQGILSVELRENELVKREVGKIEARREKYGLDPSDQRIVNDEKLLAEICDEAAKIADEKAAVKKIADTKFGARERQINKMQDPDQKAKALAELNAGKAKAEQAKSDYLEIQKKAKSVATRKSAISKELKALKDRAQKWEEYTKEIEAQKAKMLPMDVLIDRTRERAKYYDALFGHGNFYIEIQYHGIELEKEIYPVLAKIARELHIPIVASNDVHMATNSPDDLLRRRILRSLRFGNGFAKEEPGDDQLYIKTDAELKAALMEILPEDVVDEGIANIRTLFDRITATYQHTTHYPTYIIDGSETAEELLEKEARKGIAWRFPKGFPDEKKYEERLVYELGIINSMGYANYHLVVKDYLEYGRELGAVPKDKIPLAPFDIEELRRWKKENGWKVGFSIGPGRGSAVGSLVCYLLGITALDPIKYNLLFERFLNPERVSMPDIDSDLSNTVRQKVIQYVQHKYGKDAVCGIMTQTIQAPRGAVRIAAKYYGYDKKNDGTAFLSLADTIAKQIPQEPGVAFDKIENGSETLYDRLRNMYKDNADALEILRWAKIMEGSFTAYSAHAAGIVISDGTPIKDHIPLRWNQKLGEYTTQMDMVSVEESGFLKMDFLGLKTLDIITDCIKEIYKNHGTEIDPLQIPLDEADVYKKIFCEGRTKAVFQFESSGMRNMLTRFKPDNFEDLIILVAMFRPGPLQYLDGVIDVKHGKKPEYITPKLIPLLSNTYSAIVFQEQVMQIFQDLAGYTLGGADQVRRAMSKKKAKVLQAERPIFVNGIDEKDKVVDGKIVRGRHIKGCVANGINELQANMLFDQMTDFAKYAFNRSHAAVYALIGYQTAWLKLHYPAEFLMAAMNWAEKDDIPGLMQEARLLNVHVLAPDINRSHSSFNVDNGQILFGLGAVKTVGSSSDDIIRVRNEGGPFNSFAEFFLRTNVKKNAVENLIKAGAFDAFSTNRKAMIETAPKLQTIAKKLRETVAKREDAVSLNADLELAEDVDQFQLFHSLTKEGTKMKSRDQLSDKIRKREETLASRISELQAELRDTHIDESVQEDFEVRMNEEREFLGVYVTANPLDSYPEPEDIGATPVSDITDKTTKVFGLIREVTIKYRKSDKRPMAFITLEDRTGDLNVCVFTRQYERLQSMIQEGAIVVISGSAVSEEFNDTEVWKFYAENIVKAKKKQTAVCIRRHFHRFVMENQTFRDQYSEKGGHPFYIYDLTFGELRKMNYNVSDRILELDGVTDLKGNKLA